MSMNISLLKIIPSAPFVERGKRIIFGSHPKGRYIVYTYKNHVIILDIEKNEDNDIYYGHTAQVLCAKYSPSGFYIASGDATGKIQIWDTTQKTHLLKNEFALIARVNDLAWSSDNARIAVGGNGNPKFVKVINSEMGTECGDAIGMQKQINTVDFKPTRPFRLVCGGEDQGVYFYESPRSKFIKSCSAHKNFVNCCRYSPSGNLFVTACASGKIIAYDGTSADEIGEFGCPAHKNGIYGLDFSPSGNRMVSVSADKTIKLWDPTIGSYKLLSQFAFENVLENMLLGCIWTGNKIVTVALSGAMATFDAPDDCLTLNPPVKINFGHSRPINCSVFSKRANVLITASYDTVMLKWNVSTDTAEPFVGSEKHTNAIIGVVEYEDNVVSVGVDDRLVVSSIEQCSYKYSRKLNSQPQFIGCSEKGLVFVVCYKHLYLFSLKDSSEIVQLKVSDISDEPSTGAISSSGRLMAVGNTNGAIILYTIQNDTDFAEVSNISEKVSGEPTAMAFSPDENYLSVGDSNRLLSLYKIQYVGEIPSLSKVYDLKNHSAKITCLAWTPNSKYFVSGSLDCGLFFYTPTKNMHVSEFRRAHPASMITSLTWKSDEVLWSTGHDACIRSWIFK